LLRRYATGHKSKISDRSPGAPRRLPAGTEYDSLGLDSVDRKLLLAIIENFKGGPVGIDTIAAMIAEDPLTLEMSMSLISCSWALLTAPNVVEMLPSLHMNIWD
jgi:hypothetical protein